MKRLISFILVNLFLILTINCFAQNDLKYKDVYEFLKTKSEQEAYSQFRAFQKQDPYHANTYYQLGVLSQKWAKKYDPLTEYSDLKHFSNEEFLDNDNKNNIIDIILDIGIFSNIEIFDVYDEMCNYIRISETSSLDELKEILVSIL